MLNPIILADLIPAWLLKEFGRLQNAIDDGTISTMEEAEEFIAGAPTDCNRSFSEWKIKRFEETELSK